MTGASSAADDAIRLDKLLWYLRFARSRGAAQAMVAEGRTRLDGRRAERASALVRVGSVLVLPRGQGSMVVRVLRLPVRRGPATEAMACYEMVDPA